MTEQFIIHESSSASPQRRAAIGRFRGAEIERNGMQPATAMPPLIKGLNAAAGACGTWQIG